MDRFTPHPYLQEGLRFRVQCLAFMFEIEVNMETEINLGVEGARWRWGWKSNPHICTSISIYVPPYPTPRYLAPRLSRTMLKCWNLEITGGSLGRSQLKLPSTGYVFIVVLLHYPYTFGVK